MKVIENQKFVLNRDEMMFVIASLAFLAANGFIVGDAGRNLVRSIEAVDPTMLDNLILADSLQDDDIQANIFRAE